MNLRLARPALVATACILAAGSATGDAFGATQEESPQPPAGSHAAQALPPVAPSQAVPPEPPPPTFAAEPSLLAQEVTLAIKLYGDSGFTMRNNADQPSSSASVYAPNVWSSFMAPHLDIFTTADIDKLSFLSEIMFEGDNNGIAVDVERLQIAYTFTNWLRVRAGRSHMAFGYYNDAYHHGNIFELTTGRPYSAQFEDGGGLILAHNVGVSIDGALDTDKFGSFRYDLEVGNGRNSDITSVALQFSEKNEKSVNLRLRWMPLDGLIFGVNGMRDVVPGLVSATPTVPSRPKVEEIVLGAHAVYNEHDIHLDVEGFGIRHNGDDGVSSNIYGGFAELGYSFGAFTPYVRPEYVRFPSAGDAVYQFSAESPQGAIVGGQSAYYATKDFSDVRLGVKWLAFPQLALKLEVERLAHDSRNQEILNLKLAFGF